MTLFNAKKHPKGAFYDCSPVSPCGFIYVWQTYVMGQNRKMPEAVLSAPINMHKSVILHHGFLVNFAAAADRIVSPHAMRNTASNSLMFCFIIDSSDLNN